MRKIKAKLYWMIGVVSFVLLSIAVYFYLPIVFGDEVYPLEYKDLIVKYSKQYEVDPALVSAVILQESRFNPNAKSSVGAQGLMQFMPSTAAMMAKETGYGTKYNIYDPETSIVFGAAHLRDLLIKYDNNLDAALAAYNAGTGNADKWVRSGILDKIPFRETNTYVKKVKNYYKAYTEIYAEELELENKEPVYVAKVDKSAEVRGFFWSQIFVNVFGAFGK